MRSALAMVAGVAALLAVSDARGQDGQLTTEIRCLMATMIMLHSDPAPDVQDVLTTIGIHYLSRIDVRDPSLDVSTALIQARPHVEAAGAQEMFGRCAEGFREKMKSFASVLRGDRK